MELDLADLNLPMLLDNCTTLVRERASRQGLTLALEVEDGLGDWVADVRKLKQVVINLLSNAVKFTPAGGRVTLRARRLDHAVEIAVVDTGVGIAADQQALVFEEFRQAGGDYLRKSEGTGLGLSLAKRFVELHGGSMRVDSEPARARPLRLSFPSACWRQQHEQHPDRRGQREEHEAGARHPAPPGPRDAGGRQRPRRRAAGAGEQRPDLVLMDIQLPDIDGIEALRRHPPGRALDAMPVLAVSASVMPDDQQKIISSGFDAFITKPINLKQFVETVQPLAGERRVAR